MLNRIVDKATIVTLLGGAPSDILDLKRALARAPLLVCADGGANFALKQGVTPNCVIGDLDSLDMTLAQDHNLVVVKDTDQDTTDFEKCMDRLNAETILGVGFLGGRLDHELAALNVLTKYPHKKVILVGVEDVVLRISGRLNIDLEAGNRVSLFPITPVRARSSGLRWSVDGLDLRPNGMVATSNEALGGRVRVDVDSGDLLAILPVACLDALIAS